MYIEFCKSKIAHGHITESQLYYEGSITVAKDILEAADIIPGEKVEVLNMQNGNRFTTYAIAGEEGSGEICLNGPAARLGIIGDQVIILSYVLLDKKEARKASTRILYLDDNNRIKN